MKIVVAPDSFKESMTAKEACDSIERGIVTVFPYWEIVKVPMADGGEGTLESLRKDVKSSRRGDYFKIRNIGR